VNQTATVEDVARIPQDTPLKENSTNYNEEFIKKVSENVTRTPKMSQRAFLTLLPLLHAGKMEYLSTYFIQQ